MDTKIIKKQAKQVMTVKPKVVLQDSLVAEAINIMNGKKVTSLFVCKNSEPIGIVHSHDLLRLST